MKPSKYYQKLLQVTSRGSDIILFFVGYFLGREQFIAAALLLLLRLASGYVISELVYKRLQASIREGGNETE